VWREAPCNLINVRLTCAAVLLVTLSGCGSSGSIQLSPAQQLATLEVDGDIPTQALTVEAETLLRELTQACDETAAEIVAAIRTSKSEILASGQRESAIGIGRAILTTSSSFKERDCEKVAALMTYTITH
jgi:predicted small lipoprotein YifL